MTGGYWYVSDGDTHFNWSKTPTFECPFSVTPSDELLIAIADASLALGMDTLKLAKMIDQPHRHGSRREKVNDKYTDKCAHCGAKMKRLGFRAWITEPVPEEEWTAHTKTNVRIADRLGFGAAGGTTRVVRATWHKTKREAEAWCRHECKRSVAAA